MARVKDRIVLSHRLLHRREDLAQHPSIHRSRAHFSPYDKLTPFAPLPSSPLDVGHHLPRWVWVYGSRVLSICYCLSAVLLKLMTLLMSAIIAGDARRNQVAAHVDHERGSEGNRPSLAKVLFSRKWLRVGWWCNWQLYEKWIRKQTASKRCALREVVEVLALAVLTARELDRRRWTVTTMTDAPTARDRWWDLATDRVTFEKKGQVGFDRNVYNAFFISINKWILFNFFFKYEYLLVDMFFF